MSKKSSMSWKRNGKIFHTGGAESNHFFCPPVSVINGGIKNIFRMAETLRKQSRDAVIFEQNAQRPAWFASTAPIVGQGQLPVAADTVFVLPEDQPHILADFAKLPQRKVIYSQNHFYSALGIGEAASFADYGVTHILCSSRTICDHSRMRHPSVESLIVPLAIDRALFRPAVKQDMIAFMPRKRPIEAAYIRDMFRFQYPQFRHWQWREISGQSESGVAQMLGEARVFLSLSRLEGFGLTPLEAMAAGCVVAGFTGIGGREYATECNGFWASEDDFPACIEQLGKAVTRGFAPDAETTLANYTPDIFRRAVAETWQHILG